MAEKQDFAAVAGDFNTLLTSLVERLFGPSVGNTSLDGFKWEDIIVIAFPIASVMVVDCLARLFLRKGHKKAGDHPGATVLHGLVDAVTGPLRLLIWSCGIYFSAAFLVLRLSPGARPQMAAVVLGELFDLSLFVALFWLFFGLMRVLDAWVVAWAARSKSKLDKIVAPLLARSLRVIVPVLGIVFALPVIGLPPEWAGIVSKGSSIMVIVAIAWILFEAVNLGEQAVLAKYDVTASDNLHARKVYTQVHVIRKMCYVLILILSLASVLMLFEEMRRLGATLLASAGVAGIIVGFAAQHTIANLFAGLQIALTQPIRMDDVLIVEGEWGRVEEIALTYVVLHIWDDRRLVVPLSYFIEKPFQNWTRVSASLLGSVFLWVDYTLPVAEVRAAAGRIVEGSPLWDKRFWNLQVSDADEHTMQLRVLATAADSSKAWDLRCEIREKLIEFVQKHHPQGLPRSRVDLSRPMMPASQIPSYADHATANGAVRASGPSSQSTRPRTSG